jgi:Cys-tRNA(Pro) deacylase
MAETKPIMTTAIRQIMDHDIPFTSHFYKYEEKGGTAVSSRELGVEEHVVIKTLIMETETKFPLIVLMHGDCQVSTKQLARIMNVKTISPCDPEVANRHSGFVVGGTSPFGTKKSMPVYLEKTILDLDRIYLNGGKRGFLINIRTQDLVTILKPHIVEITA